MDEDIGDGSFEAEIIQADLHDLCRICGSTSDSPLISLYEGNGLAEELPSKILLYLPIKISEEDILPLKVCVNCANSVLTWHLLYECCLDADNRFKKMLSEEQLIEEDQQATETHELDSAVQLAKENDVQIYEGDRVELERETDDILMLKAEFGPEDEQYLEDESDLNSDENESENDQQPIKHSIFENVDSADGFELINVDLLEDVEPIKCASTSLRPPILNTISKNSAILGSDGFTCPECNTSYLNKSEFHTHLLDMHKNNHELIVMLGHKPVKIDMKTISDARTIIDRRELYKCCECNKLLSSAYCYRNHLLIHRNERPYSCLFCDKSFRSHSGIVRHIRDTHFKIKRFTCDICENKFTNLVNLQQHYRLHTKERPYVCDVCGKSFKQKASLFMHSRTHQNTFPYKCMYCDKGFRTKIPMLLHTVTHTGEREHKCDVCNKMFRQKTDMHKHKQLHSETMPFKCQECSVAFKQKRYLTRHYKSHHPSVSRP